MEKQLQAVAAEKRGRVFCKAQQELVADLLVKLNGLELLDPIHAWKWKGAGRLDADVAGKADVFALSSRYEGFGNVLIEAMACGVPVVATKSAGTTEIVRHGVDGLLVDTHDPSSLSRALATLIADPKVLERMSAAAVQGAERFALPRIARLYDETLMGALA